MSVTPLRAVHALGRFVPAVRAFRRALVPPADGAPACPVPVSPRHRTVAVVFTDIEGFTALGERLGDERAQEVLHAHRAIVRRELHRHRGIEVKTQGDGFMLVFDEACDAVACAVGIQRATLAWDAARHGEPIRIHVGVHVGPVIEEGGDFYGRTVVLAARLAGAARGGEILVSDAVRDTAAERVLVDGGRDVTLKGFTAACRVFAVRWDWPAEAAAALAPVACAVA